MKVSSQLVAHSSQFRKNLVHFFCLLPLIFLSACQNRPLYKDTQVMMGTFVEVVSPHKEASGIVFAEIKRIENLLSKYKEDSEIVRLNRLGELKVSPETFYILKKAGEFWKLSGGAFDVTVGPLLDLWGFSDKKYRLPSKPEIEEALKLVGFEKIILNPADNVIKFSTRGLKIDLGAIAKGYALDCAIKKLKENKINSCLINAGGQVYCLGTRQGSPWRVAVQDPRGKGFLKYIDLKDKAIATSGDYQQYFVVDKKRYQHIFDPRSGYPVNNGLVSVTLIASDGLTADALATSICVLGRQKAEGLLKNFKNIKVELVGEK